jgi:hypothetical protein
VLLLKGGSTRGGSEEKSNKSSPIEFILKRLEIELVLLTSLLLMFLLKILDTTHSSFNHISSYHAFPLKEKV